MIIPDEELREDNRRILLPTEMFPFEIVGNIAFAGDGQAVFFTRKYEKVYEQVKIISGVPQDAMRLLTDDEKRKDDNEMFIAGQGYGE